MGLIKRWTTTITSNFDWIITQVENHEALVASALSDMQLAERKARVQLGRVRKDGETLSRKLAELAAEEERWRDRAVRVAQSDQERALECLRRRREIQRDIKLTQAQLTEHDAFEQQLAADIKAIGERIAKLKRKKNALTARQYRGEAMHASAADQLGLIAEIDEIFDRWETKLEERELGAYTATDTFEDQFLSEESRVELQLELEQLVSETADEERYGD